TYDLMDGLSRVDYPDGNYVSYSYDNACRLTAVTTPFGTTAYEYDLLDRLVRVVDRNGYATVYEYDANGNRTAVRYANGLTTTYDYDLLNRLIKQETVDSEGNVVVQYIYALGVAGERLSVTELDRTVEYSYDSLYRLTSETITEGEDVTVYSYAYDSVSNRILKTENGAETAYVYNALNQLVSDSETSYEYDLNGNLVRVIGSANSALYEYNAENKLVKATVQNGSLVVEETYTYDYQGNRTSKTTRRSDGNTEFVKYLNDTNSDLTNVLCELDENGTVKCNYTLGADLISQERDGKVSVYLYDGHGSVVGLANENGIVTDTYSYDAFGNLLKSTGTTANNYRYCGEQFDSTTGLYYLRARYMDTTTGRFISQDSYAGSIDDPVSLHKYLYANSNPVMYSDPSGYMSSLAEAAIAGAAIGALSGYIVPNVLAVLKCLDMDCDESYLLSPMDNLKNILQGIISGALFGVMIASGLAFIVIGASLFGGLFSAISGFSEMLRGNYRTAMAYSVLSIVSFFCCLKLFSPVNKGQSTGAYNGKTSGGNGLGKLSGKNIKVSEKGLQILKAHLKANGFETEFNNAMIARLESALESGQTITGADASFYMHEIAESTFMKGGMSYDCAHAAALNKYGVSPFSVYHIDVIKVFYEEFNQSWIDFWNG
ncbi:MAG: hypothetical protein IJ366_09110, partial [Clostridia bacterium]|nr:hypothetical protein [Clostridia bacterium]